MSQDLGPGDIVESLVSGDTPFGKLIAGAAYTVTAIVDGDIGSCGCHGRNDQCGILIEELPLPPGAAWCPLNFRKRPPAREAAFRALLEPVASRVPAAEPEGVS